MAAISFPKAESCTILWRSGHTSQERFRLGELLEWADALGAAVVRVTRDRDGAVLIDSAPVVRHAQGLVSFA